MQRVLIWIFLLFFPVASSLALETPEESLPPFSGRGWKRRALLEKYDMRGLISKGVGLFMQDLRATRRWVGDSFDDARCGA